MKIYFKKIVSFLWSIDSSHKLGNVIAFFHSGIFFLTTCVLISDFLMRGWMLAVAGGLVALYLQYKVGIANWNHVLRQNSEEEVEPLSKKDLIRFNSLALRLLGPFAIFGATLLIYVFMHPEQP